MILTQLTPETPSQILVHLPRKNLVDVTIYLDGNEKKSLVKYLRHDLSFWKRRVENLVGKTIF